MPALMPERVWEFLETPRAQVLALAEALGRPPLVAQLLLQRGIAEPAEARDYLYPRLAHLSDPGLLSDMDRAVARVQRARARQERVLIFGDYDVDGVSATALLCNGLRRFGLEHVECATPHRLYDGYGIAPQHVESAKANGVDLIITVDNGIRAHPAAEHAAALGMDLIITDHHALDTTLPPAVAVLNPKRESPAYPGYHLCGAGVALKLCTALLGDPYDLDIAALATIADIMPLTGENRTIVALGLKHMAKHQRVGLAALATAARIELSGIRSEQVAYQLAPRLNAAGRIDCASAALALLQCTESAEADRLAQELCAANEERRSIEESILRAALLAVETPLAEGRCGVILDDAAWHPGVVGIVASRVQQRIHRPVALLCHEDEGAVLKGSARAGHGFDLVAALDACADLLVKHGGHRAAAGLTVATENLPALRERFAAVCAEQCGGSPQAPPLRIDALAALSQVDGALLQALAQLEPFGQGNPRPILGAMQVDVVPDSARVLSERHLKLLLRQGDAVHEAIGFGLAEDHPPESLPPQIDIAFVPGWNTFRGTTKLQLQLVALRPA